MPVFSTYYWAVFKVGSVILSSNNGNNSLHEPRLTPILPLYLQSMNYKLIMQWWKALCHRINSTRSIILDALYHKTYISQI